MQPRTCPGVWNACWEASSRAGCLSWCGWRASPQGQLCEQREAAGSLAGAQPGQQDLQPGLPFTHRQDVGDTGGAPSHPQLLSPYLTRRRRRVLLPPTSTGLPASSRAWCTAGSRPGTRSHGEPAGLGPGKESEGAGRGLPQPSLSSPSIPAKGWPGLRGWAVSGTELEGRRNTSLQDWRQQSSLGVPARPILHSLYHYPDSDSSSSSEEVFPCCHRPCCQLCLQSPRGSLGSSSSSSTETDMEPGGAVGCWLEPQGKTQPVVNFKEDLKPTFV